MKDQTRDYGAAALGGRLRRLSDSIDEDARRLYADLGVDCQQRWVGVLEQLAKHGPQSVSQLAEALGIRHSSVSQTRHSLETSGLVYAEADPKDARSRRLNLSTAGLQLVKRLEPLWTVLNAASVALDKEAGHVVAALDALDSALSRMSLYDRVTALRSTPKGATAKGATPRSKPATIVNRKPKAASKSKAKR